MKRTRKPLPVFIRVLLITAGLAVGAITAAYLVVPHQVARGIVEAGKRPKPVTDLPSGRSMPYNDVGFVTSDGVTLNGWWIPAPKGKPAGTVILTHGLFKNRDQMMSRVEFLHRAGYQALVFDLRGHGMSGYAPLSGGQHEARDLLAALEWTRNEKKEIPPTAFFGLSLGAMAALRASADAPDVAVIADSPLSDGTQYVGRRTPGRWLLFLPFFFERCVTAYNRLTGLSLTSEDLRMEPVLRDLRGRRLLFFVGEKDDLATPEGVRRLFVVAPTPDKQLVYAPNAAHDQTYQNLKVMYEKAVLRFLAGRKDMGDQGDLRSRAWRAKGSRERPR